MIRSTIIESLASSSYAASTTREKKSLTFDVVEIRHHRVMPDPVSTDKYSQENRVPFSLTLSWKCSKSEVLSVQEFECRRLKRRKESSRPLDAKERFAKLTKAGYSVTEICEAEDPARKSKRDPPPKRGLARSFSDGDKAAGKMDMKSILTSFMKQASKTMGAVKLKSDSANSSLAIAA